MRSTAGKRLRIAIHHNLDEGGALRALRAFSKALAVRHDVHRALLERGGGADDLSSDAHFTHFRRESPFYYMHKLGDLRNLREADRAAAKLARAIDRGGFDVALLHPCRFGQAPSILRYLSTPTIYYCNEPLRLYREQVPYEDGASRSWKMRAGRALFAPLGSYLNRRDTHLARRASLIVTNSLYSAAQITEVYGRSAPVVYPGIDTRLYRPLPEVKRRSYLLSVGKLVERKGHFLALKIIAAIPKESRPALVVAGFEGSTSFQRRLELEAVSAGIPLTVRPNPDDKEMVTLYNRALLTLAVSRREPLGLVPLESQACGTPVAALDEAGFRETVLPGKTGLLMSADPESAGAEIMNLLTNRDRLESFGIAGRVEVEENWSLERSGDRLRAIVEDYCHGE